jgi:hypothetical protein
MALIKHHLRRALSKGVFPKLATLNSIQTCLAEISLILNSRPITFDSSNPAEVRPLAPINFLQPLRNLAPVPFPPSDSALDPSFNPAPASCLSHLLVWSKLSTASRSFWAKWRLDYLVSLRERHKKIVPTDRLLSTWSTAVIISLHQKGDVADVPLSSGRLLTRSIHHLYPLETADNFPSESWWTSRENPLIPIPCPPFPLLFRSPSQSVG